MKFHWRTSEINKKGLKRPKKYFSQLSGARSTWKLVKIDNIWYLFVALHSWLGFLRDHREEGGSNSKFYVKSLPRSETLSFFSVLFVPGHHVTCTTNVNTSWRTWWRTRSSWRGSTILLRVIQFNKILSTIFISVLSNWSKSSLSVDFNIMYKDKILTYAPLYSGDLNSQLVRYSNGPK